MSPEKFGKFIKELRQKNHLTQAELADKYGVTYQAVSKWENGINLPDISLIRQISKDFDVSMEEILDGELSPAKKRPKKNKIFWGVGIGALVLILSVVIYFLFVNPKSTFEFKTLSSTCSAFEVSGSIAYDQKKSSIYISNIEYCGGDDTTVYQTIECSLYESLKKGNQKISDCKNVGKNVTLEGYLKDVELNIAQYTQSCKDYLDNSLYLEIHAVDQKEQETTYKIPLSIHENCPR